MITSIKRDYGVDPAIVRINTTDSLDDITTAGYLFSESETIQEINGGTFQWATDDYVLIAYDESWGFFLYDIATDTLSAAPLPLFAGTGITITESGTGTTISSNDSGVAWVTISGVTQAAVVDTGYIIGNSSQTTVTLPAIASAGATVIIVGQGAAGWVLAPGAGQTIKILTGSASIGITSAERYDAIEVVCVTANTTWVVRNSMTTGFTVS